MIKPQNDVNVKQLIRGSNYWVNYLVSVNKQLLFRKDDETYAFNEIYHNSTQ